MSVSFFELVTRVVAGAMDQYSYEYQRRQEFLRKKKKRQIVILCATIVFVIVVGIILFMFGGDLNEY